MDSNPQWDAIEAELLESYARRGTEDGESAYAKAVDGYISECLVPLMTFRLAQAEHVWPDGSSVSAQGRQAGHGDAYAFLWDEALKIHDKLMRYELPRPKGNDYDPSQSSLRHLHTMYLLVRAQDSIRGKRQQANRQVAVDEAERVERASEDAASETAETLPRLAFRLDLASTHISGDAVYGAMQLQPHVQWQVPPGAEVRRAAEQRMIAGWPVLSAMHERSSQEFTESMEQMSTACRAKLLRLEAKRDEQLDRIRPGLAARIRRLRLDAVETTEERARIQEVLRGASALIEQQQEKFVQDRRRRQILQFWIPLGHEAMLQVLSYRPRKLPGDPVGFLTTTRYRYRKEVESGKLIGVIQRDGSWVPWNKAWTDWKEDEEDNEAVEAEEATGDPGQEGLP